MSYCTLDSQVLWKSKQESCATHVHNRNTLDSSTGYYMPLSYQKSVLGTHTIFTSSVRRSHDTSHHPTTSMHTAYPHPQPFPLPPLPSSLTPRLPTPPLRRTNTSSTRHVQIPPRDFRTIVIFAGEEERGRGGAWDWA